jgi:hypothetical protein
VDSSVAGKAHTLPLMDGWNRPAPPAATLIPPVNSVRPSDDPKQVRDRKKNGSDGNSSDRHSADGHAPDGDPRDEPSPAHLTLQAIDPATGRVLWQDLPSLPGPGIGIYATTSSPAPTRILARRAARSDGLLGKRAYGSVDDGDDDALHVSKTA